MPMPKAKFSSNITDFGQTLKTLDANDADFLHIREERQEMQTLVTELEDLNVLQATLNARSQQATKDLNEKMDRALVLYAQLRSAVKAKYGTRSERLTEFRLRPLRRRRTTNPAKKPPSAPAPPPVPPATTTSTMTE
jgi:type I site-specific restriction endonuclease